VDVPEGWRFVAIGVEGEAVLLDGVDVWQAPWTGTGSKVTVPHPQYPEQRHGVDEYRVDTPSGLVTFAAGEYSNGVWGFFQRA
jgi:hypothetical protein